MAQQMVAIGEDFKPVANALSFFDVYLNLSCEPNTTTSVVDGEVRVRTTQALKAGQELTVTYTHPCRDVDIRRDHLEEGYMFKCQCKTPIRADEPTRNTDLTRSKMPT